MIKRFVWTFLPLGILLSCDGSPSTTSPEGEPEQAALPTIQENTLGFETWHADFPHPVHLSPQDPQGYYHVSPQEAVERLVSKLQGNCTRAGWTMAMAFPERAPESAVPLMVEALDRAMQAKHLSDVVQNTAEVMGKMGRYGRPELASALLRALEHSKVSVQNAAMAALIHSGTPEAVRAARAIVPQLHLRAQADWVRAVRKRLPEDEIEQIFVEILQGNSLMFGIVVEEAVKLPLPVAARILGSLWAESRDSLRLTVASTLHASGDLRGTRFLREVLQSSEGDGKAIAIVAAARGKLDYLRDDILKLSLDSNATVRQSVALTIGGLPGENIDNVLATLAVDPADDVRRSALAMLRGREQRDLLDRLIQRVRTASGSKLIQALGDLSAAADGKAVAAIVERMEATPREEWRKFVQALGLSRTAEAFLPLKKLFLEEEAPIDTSGGRTNVGYVAVVLSNLQSSREEIFELFSSLPRDDYRRRGSLLYTLGDLAAVTEDDGFSKRVLGLFREIVHDASDLPQMRLLALQYLRRDLRLDDMKSIKKLQKTEEGPMRRALTDFLFEFF